MPGNTELVWRVFDQLFGEHPEVEELRQALLEAAGKESARVQLAALKLSEGNADGLRQSITAAKTDYRDVLAWAEYPEQLRSGATRFNTPPERYQAILQADRKQYEDWLEAFRGPDRPAD